MVATPIGNLGDITLRALHVLRHVDLIACEDTRVSRKLLAHYDIRAAVVSYHDHNAQGMAPRLIDRIRAGGSVALISDAGTPLISDPGYRLVTACQEHGIPVVPIPGASSLLTLLCAAGLPTDRFFFTGFLPVRAAQRVEALSELRTIRATVVILESARRVVGTLRDLADGLGDRQAAVGRELTKKFEEIRRGSLSALADHYAGANILKGEITLAIAPPDDAVPVDDAAVDQALAEAMTRQTPSRAAAEVAATTGRTKQDVYKRALALKQR